MDVHNRFMRHRVSEVKQLLMKSKLLYRILNDFNGIVENIKDAPGILEYIETVHTVFCFLYQEKNTPGKDENIHFEFHQDSGIALLKMASIQPPISVDKNTENEDTTTSDLTFKFAGISVNAIHDLLDDETLCTKFVSLLLDILVLYMVLFYDTPLIMENIAKLLKRTGECINKAQHIKLSDVKSIECYLNCLLLHRHNSTSLTNLKAPKSDVSEVEERLVRNVQLLLMMKDPKKYQALTLLLPKAIEVMGDRMIPSMWDMIFLLPNDPGEILSILFVTADVWFPIGAAYNEQLIKQSLQESFWLRLLNGLWSPLSQERKQAMYLIKRAIDFAGKHMPQDLEFRPLTYTENYNKQNALKKNANNFLLISEALEEKHCSTAVFPLLKTLLHERNEHNSFRIAWIRCLLSRILQHNDSSIIKEGLLNAFAIGLDLYNDKFLGIVLDVLNNVYLYETDMIQKEPNIVKGLIDMLNYAETKDSDLTKRFLVKASNIAWNPVVLFYVIHTLSVVKKGNGIWEEVELQAVKSLVQKTSEMHCPILRRWSHVKLLEALTHFTTKPLNLVAVGNVLSAFSVHGALIRGEPSWDEISAWISNSVTEAEAVDFFAQICEQNEDFSKQLDMKSFSLVIMLLHDGHLLFESMLCPERTLLENMLNCLNETETELYAYEKSRYRAIELISHLIDHTSEKDCVLHELISVYSYGALQFTFQNLRYLSNEACINDVNTYVSVTHNLLAANDSKIQAIDWIDKFNIESWNIISDAKYCNNMRHLFAVKLLYTCLQLTTTDLTNYKFISPLYNTYKTLMPRSSEDAANLAVGIDENKIQLDKVTAKYNKIVARLFNEYLEDEPTDKWISDINWIKEVLYLIESGETGTLVSIVGILSLVFHNETVATSDIEMFISTTRLCWKSMVDTSQLASEEIMDLIFSPEFLKCAETRQLTIECTQEIIEKGDTVPSLKVILIEKLEQVDDEYLGHFYEAVVACLLHGTVSSCDQRVEIQARSYVVNCYQEVYSNYLSAKTEIRARAVILLHTMIINESAHAVKLLPLIVAKLSENQNTQHNQHLQAHCSKYRILQILLILQPVLEQDDLEPLHTLIRNNLSDTDEPCVRIMQEWLLITMYLNNETLLAKIWELFDQSKLNGVGNLCSVLSILYHVARLVPSNLQPTFINETLHHIVPWCMSRQLNVYMYAQVILSRLYDLAAKMSYSAVTDKYQEVYNVFSKSLTRENLMSDFSKLKDYFYFAVFDANADYSLQTIFHELPRLLNVPLDEYILPQTFDTLGFKESDDHRITILNLNSALTDAAVSSNILKTTEGARSETGNNDTRSDCSTDIRKTVVPWKLMSHNDIELDKVSKTSMSHWHDLTRQNNLVLVASLVDKPTDLSSLSRTCQILGIEEFVVASNPDRNKEFEGFKDYDAKSYLLVEVKPIHLQHYLTEKRKLGYQVVGTQQRDKGTNLMDMKFNKKTVLLLGNEQTGIPENLISLLDERVQIPQSDVVDPLNVHTTTSICVWEYFKQHLS